MKILIFLIVPLFFMFDHSASTNKGKCIINGVDDFNWTTYYKLPDVNDMDKVKHSFTFQGTLEVTQVKSLYFSVKTENTELIIESNQNFTMLDDIYFYENPKDMIDLIIDVKFLCAEGESSLRFGQKVADINGHDPTFTFAIFTLSVPMPIMPKYTLSNFGNRILVSDKDFSNSAIKVNISPEDVFHLNISTLPGQPKTYEIILSAIKPIWYYENKNFQLTAEDSGINPRHGSALLSIELDRDASYPVDLSFSKPNYSFNYTKDGLMTNEKIRINTLSTEDIHVSIDSPYFQVYYDPSNKQVTILKNGEIDDAEKNILVFVLKAESADGGNASCAILMNMPYELLIHVPKFTSIYYTAQYIITSTNHKHSIKVNRPIEVTDNVDMTDIKIIDQDIKNYFDLNKNEENQWILSLKRQLPDDVVKIGGQLVFTLEASLIGKTIESDHSTVLVDFPKIQKTPKFSQTYYTGEYIIDTNNYTVILDNGPIAIVNQINNSVDVYLNGRYCDNFQLTNDVDHLLIHVKQPLDENILKNQTEIVLTLYASVQGALVKGSALVILQLPEIGTLPPPKFSKITYIGQYRHSDRDRDLVTLEDIIISNKSALVTIFGNYENNFVIIQGREQPNNIFINVIDNLPQEILANTTEILLNLQATLEGVNDTDLASVLLKLPKFLAPPKFSQTYYTANYITGDQIDTLEMIGGNISVTSDHAQLFLIGSKSDYFTLQNFTRTWYVSVSNKLNEEVIKNNNQLLFTLKIINTYEVNRELATFIINLPKFERPKFSQNYYIAKYVVNKDTTDLVQMSNKIKIAGKGVQLNLIGKYLEHFQEIFENGTCSISVVLDLEEDILKKEKYIIFNLVASIKGIEEKGSATLIIQLPEIKPAIVPTFSQLYYKANYFITNVNNAPAIHSINLTNIICIIGENIDSVSVMITGQYQDNFELKEDFDDADDSLSWRLTVKNNLNDELLNNTRDIVLTLEATFLDNKNKGYATVVVDLPLKNIIVPKFSSLIYNAVYDIGGNIVMKEGNNIYIQNDDRNETKIEVIGEYKELFVVSAITFGYKINLKNNLSEEILHSLTDIEIALVASRTDTTVTASAIVVIDLPLKEIVKIPKFSKISYIASYFKGQNGVDILNFNENIALFNYNNTNVSITLNGIHKEYFNIELKNQKWEFSLKENIPIDILNKEICVILTLIASTDATPSTGVTNIIVELPKSDNNTAIYFKKVMYTAQYLIDGSKHFIHLNTDIELEGELLNSIDIELSGAYKEYFEESYNQREVTITLRNNLPDDVLNNKTVIQVNINAKIKNTHSVVSSAALFITLPKSTDNDEKAEPLNTSGYIACISILSCLLVGFVGTAVLIYYFKIRDLCNYSQMDEPEQEENRFSKNPAPHELKVMDHPKRRPTTGLVKYENHDEEGESDDDNKERRKSVAFDEKVETLRIESNDEEQNEEL